jgi:hypothetical protein
VIEPGEAAVNAQKLAEIAAKPRGDVRVEVSVGPLIIKCGRSRFTLTMHPLDDYPDGLAVARDIQPIDLRAADVMALFDGVAAAAARDDKRIYLSGPVLLSQPWLATGFARSAPTASRCRTRRVRPPARTSARVSSPIETRANWGSICSADPARRFGRTAS